MSSKAAAAGALLIVLGALVAAGPTFGFSTVSSDRDVHVAVGDSSSALLALESLETTVTDQNERARILGITNNANDDLALVIDVTVGDGLSETSGFATELAPGERTTYAVTCQPGSGAGETPVDVLGHSATGERLSIERVSGAFQIDRDCPGPGSTPGEPGSGEVYEIRQEHWTDDREHIFRIVRDDVSSVEWDFGDGTTASDHYVRHTYAEDGTYEITVTATIDGQQHSYAEMLTVTATPEEGDDKPPAEDVYEIRQEHWTDDREYIIDIVHGGVWDAEWDLGDGTTTTGHYVQHTYDDDGTYEITLTATIDGYQYTYTETLIVN